MKQGLAQVVLVSGVVGVLAAGAGGCVVRAGAGSAGPMPVAPGSPGAPPGPAPSGRLQCAAEEHGADASELLADARSIAPGNFDGCASPTDKGDAFAVTAPPGPMVLVQAEVEPYTDDDLCLSIHDQDREQKAHHCRKGLQHPWFVLAGGTTGYLSVRGQGAHDRPYRVALSMAPIPDPAENQDLSQATPLPLDTPVQGYAVDALGRAPEVDFFAITLPRAGRLELAVDEVPANVRFVGQILDSQGARVRGNAARTPSANQGAALRMSIELPAGTYVLELEPDRNDRRTFGLEDLQDHVQRPYRIMAHLQ